VVHDRRKDTRQHLIPMTRARLADIDRAKGLGVILVALGHLTVNVVPAGNAWYEFFNLLLYKFHMAFFMFITGFVMAYTYPEIHTVQDYAAYVRKRFLRLMPAYFLFAAVIVAGKTLAGGVCTIENPSCGFGDLIRVFLRPGDSCCRSLWFIYVVFLYSLVLPPLLKVFARRIELLLLLALAAYFLPRSHYFGETAACEYLFVFLLGEYAAHNRVAYSRWIDRYCLAFYVVFAGCILAFTVANVPKLLFGLASIPALHAVVRSRIMDRTYLLSLLGQYVFPIYLLNSIVTGSLLTVIQQWWSLDGVGFRIVAPQLFVAGLVIPIICYELIIRRTPVLRAIIRA
jgi:fucose 4-O-acetylase-like acetyltransferase